MEKIEIKDNFFIVSLPIHKEIRSIKRTIILSDLIHRYNSTLDKKLNIDLINSIDNMLIQK